MYTREITGTISKYDMTDLKDGGYAVFTVDSDTGPVEDARPVSGRLTVSSMRCYASSAYMVLRFDSNDGDVMAYTDNLSGDNSIHSETFGVHEPVMALMAAKPETVYLCIEATSGTSNKANFREGCTISLEIDYTLPQELLPYTDPVLIAGTTNVKAAHMTELQTNINRQREALGYPAYTFTTIRAGYTSLADWTAHVEELRAAIDQIGAEHDAWIPIPVNCPSVMVLLQLREAVEAMLP